MERHQAPARNPSALQNKRRLLRFASVFIGDTTELAGEITEWLKTCGLGLLR
jgi:hypothetical protein